MADHAAFRASGPADRPAGLPPCRSIGRAAGRAAGRADPRLAPELVTGANRRGTAGDARRRPDRGGDRRGRGRRLQPLRQPAPAHGLSRPGTERAVERQHGSPRRHHQGGQCACPPGADRGGLDLSHAGAGQPQAPRPPRAAAGQRPRHCLEGADPAVRALSASGRRRQGQGGGHHRDRSRDGRLHLGDRPPGRSRSRRADRRFAPMSMTGGRAGWGTLVRCYEPA